jgi:hypothetical protein
MPLKDHFWAGAFGVSPEAKAVPLNNIIAAAALRSNLRISFLPLL